jgi:anti-sigma-K factor RskA
VEHVDELIAGQALHALSPPDEERVVLHVAECDRCRRQLREMEAVAASLAYAAPAAAPPPELRERLLAAVEPVVPTAARAPEGRRRAWWPRVTAVLAPALAAALVVLGVWTASLQDQLESLQTNLGRGAAALPGIGTVVASADGRATLYARVTPAPAGHTYEAWVIRGKTAFPAGTFAGSGQLVLTRTARRGDTLAVPMEPAGGSPHPTTTPIAAGQLT